MDLDDAGTRVKYLIRDRDGKYPALFDTILADVGITVVLSGIRRPRINSIMERWVRTCRREPFGRWGEVFGDEVLAAAMIDRLVHHTEVLTLAGDSYRTRARRELLAKNPDK